MICKDCRKMVLPEEGHIIDGEFYCDDCTVQCDDCGDYILKDDAVETIDGDLICENCRDNDYYTCEECGEVFSSDKIIWIEDKQMYVCQECADNDYYKCEYCEKYYSKNSLRETYDDNWVCDNCYEYNYYTCNDCGYAVFNEDAYYNENDECDYCPNCYPRHPDSLYGYHDFDDFECQSTYEEDDTEEYFGFELEVSGDRCYADEFYDMTPDVVLMSDGSIVGGGFEIVTQPMTRKYFREEFRPQFEKSLKFLNDRGFKGHNKGGMHIHISAEALSHRQLAQMAEVLYGDEVDRNIWLCLSQRKHAQMNEWSSMTNKNYSFEDIANHTETEMPYISDKRFTALNRDTRTHTYEIRIFNSNTRIERIMKNMECVFALIDYSKQEEKSIYKASTRGFLNFVKEHRLEYPNLYAFMLERQVEEHFGIRYTEEELEAA